MAALPLRVTEIFLSLQGEASRVGLPTVFVRLTGCPLRCVWCDTAYAFRGGSPETVGSVLERVAAFRVHRVCVTGGEPLAQRACIDLLQALCDVGNDVSLETSGSLDVSAVDPRVSRIVDVKAPGSGEAERNHWANLALLGKRDEVKFVLADRADYDWACTIIKQYALVEQSNVLFSAVHDQLAAGMLADWIVADRLDVRLQVQLHKLLWGNVPGR
ncbi:MAG: 7-carboxy-7-deazaguanine synthase QueE [Nevskiaceae bacterium]|nr:MAG: 7-carboxy-7-deazaguanine synthase QueE [Nevskiaceae bacterium]TBR74073.1 MAG: 7-carboxy-7-deazaguanine synthase QueE [Nevskiaceae bacterium]